MRPEEILARSRTIAVVGFSRQPGKAAHDIPAELITRGWDVIPVNPLAEEILGRRSYARLADLPGPPDLVDVFRPEWEAPGVVADAVTVGASAVWLQLGIRSEEAKAIAEEAGIDYVEDHCTGALARRLDLHAPGPTGDVRPEELRVSGPSLRDGHNRRL